MNHFLRKQNFYNIHRIERNLRLRLDAVTEQLKCVQMNFMVDAAQERANQDTNSDTNTDTVQPTQMLKPDVRDDPSYCTVR